MRVITLLACLVLIAGKPAAGQPERRPPALPAAFQPPADAARLDSLNQRAFYYSTRNPVLGLRYADSAIRLASALHDDLRLAAAYQYGGLNQAACGKDKDALSLYTRAMTIVSASRDQKRQAALLHDIGLAYFNLSDYRQALSYQTRSFNIYEQTKDSRGMAAALNSTGVIFLYLSDYPSALKNYLRALGIYQQLQAEKEMATVFSNLGLVYDHLGSYDTALQYHFRALHIFKKQDEQYSMQNTLANIGNTYDDDGQQQEALTYYGLALNINRRLGNERGIASDLINTGIVYYGMKNYDASLGCLTKALKLYRRLEDKYATGITYTYLAAVCSKAPASVLAGAGIDPARRYRTALEFQNKGLALAREIGDLYSESEAWGNMSDIYARHKDYGGALHAYKKQVALRDSIFGDQKKLEISRMQMQYDFSRKEEATKAATDKKEILAAAEITRQRLIRKAVTLGAAVLLLMALVSFVLYIRKHQAEERQKEAELQAQVADTEMKALRAQMNPHFIFNSLNSIGDYISRHDASMADRFLAKFSKMMRLILEYSEYREIPLADDLKALELYIQLEAIRLHDKFSYEIKVDPSIDLENTMVPPLILQPFVENSIWHGIAKKPGKGKIVIEVNKSDQMIHCVVEDNGVGMQREAASTEGKKHLGIRLTESRIAMMNKDKGADARVTLSGLSEGLRVELKLPLVLHF
jgi:tetratricopeptide (TPR) repeat protein